MVCVCVCVCVCGFCYYCYYLPVFLVILYECLNVYGHNVLHMPLKIKVDRDSLSLSFHLLKHNLVLNLELINSR